MAHSPSQSSDPNTKCANSQPWVHRFAEEYQDGRPWGYARFDDPSIDEEVMEECLCRIDMLLWTAKDAVFGRSHEEFPRFKWEVLDWPEGGDEDEEDTEEDEEGEDEIDEEEQEEDDADISTVRELLKLRTHFKWVRDVAKKRRKEYLDIDRSGIPSGLLRNVFLVIDQDSIDSIMGHSPMADNAWIWAIDPDYVRDVASMKKNGLKEEYYGYMRVRVQQLVNNFWEVRMYRAEWSLEMLWDKARQSHNCAFVSVDEEEARMFKGSMDLGSAWSAQTV